MGYNPHPTLHQMDWLIGLGRWWGWYNARIAEKSREDRFLEQTANRAWLAIQRRIWNSGDNDIGARSWTSSNYWWSGIRIDSVASILGFRALCPGSCGRIMDWSAGNLDSAHNMLLVSIYDLTNISSFLFTNSPALYWFGEAYSFPFTEHKPRIISCTGFIFFGK